MAIIENLNYRKKNILLLKSESIIKELCKVLIIFFICYSMYRRLEIQNVAWFFVNDLLIIC
jgi:hypothetical protein